MPPAVSVLPSFVTELLFEALWLVPPPMLAVTFTRLDAVALVLAW
ncbi:hypothetical protein [Trinickia acidisoli]|nr:hypothetical protein [Trinickia acidisoli]